MMFSRTSVGVTAPVSILLSDKERLGEVEWTTTAYAFRGIILLP